MTARIRDVFVFDLSPELMSPIEPSGPIESEIQLCRTGKFYRADMGHFSVTQRTLEKMASNAVERGVDIPINYYHKGNDPNAPISDRRSAGKVSPASLSIRGYKGGYGLFGTARWTAEAAQKIKAGEVNYISPEIEWSATRLAASEAGPAGEPIGPLLTAAALVDDPFFTMNPVTLSRTGAPQRGFKFGASKRYSMISEAKKGKIAALLTEAGIKEDKLAGLMAQILVELMSEDEAPAPEVVATEEVAASATTPGAAETPAMAAMRESNKALAATVARLEAKDKKREEEEGKALFAQYQAEGRFRIYAREGGDPTGEVTAKAHFAKGVEFFRGVFEGVPPLVGQKAPQVNGKLAESTVIGSAMIGQDKGLTLHNRVMGELKTRNLTMQSAEGKKEYNRLTALYSRT